MFNSLACENALRAAYEDAILTICITRQTDHLLNGFYAKIGDAVFEAGCRALKDADEYKNARIHTVAAPVGSGKTSFSYALMMAVTRYSEISLGAPYGCLFVVDQIKKADEVYRELNELLPGKVAIWTGDHDKHNPKGEKIKNPAARFTQDELRLYPIAIVTHKFYVSKNQYKALLTAHNQRVEHRALVIIDEKPEHVTPFELTLDQAQRIKDGLLEKRPDLKDHLDDLLRLMMPYTIGNDCNTIKRPSETWGDDVLAQRLQWFKTTEAERVLKEYKQQVSGLDQLFGLAKAMEAGCAFVAPSGPLVRYVGWRSERIVRPGTVLLDATADIDGVSVICPWMQHVHVPKASYENLEIIRVPQHTKQVLSAYLKSASNRRAYVETLTGIIRDHMIPGERGLVVCKKILFDNESVPNWSEGDPRFQVPETYAENYEWEIDGRQLCAIHWGTGIGSNDWKDADVVFLMDEFFIPRRIAAANTQGLRGHRADEGDLGSMTTMNSKAEGVDIIADGHRLRHTKQLALRGRARCYDENGVCGRQRLVVSCDLQNLLRHAELLFPGAKIELTAQGDADSTYAHKVLTALSRTDPHVTIVKTKRLELRWSHFLGQPAKVGSSMRMADHEDTETVFG